MRRRNGTVSDVHDEVNVVRLCNVLAFSATSDQLLTLLALETVAHINISIQASAFTSGGLEEPTSIGIAINALAVFYGSNVRVASFARASIIALLTERVAGALTLSANLVLVQIVARNAASALVGRAGSALVIDIVTTSLAGAIVQSVALSAGLASAIVALFADDARAVRVAVSAFTVDY